MHHEILIAKLNKQGHTIIRKLLCAFTLTISERQSKQVL